MPYSGKKWSVDNVSPEVKEKRSNTGANHPSSALVLLGHGNEGLTSQTKTVVVPPGTIVVAKSHSGDVRIWKDVKRDIERLFNKDNSEYILDPVKYINKITELFGSVAIYREGDVCPNLINTRFLSFSTDEGLMVRTSGLIKLPSDETQATLNSFVNKYVVVPTAMTVSQYFEQKDKPDGINLNSVFQLAQNKRLVPFLPMFEKYMDEELRLFPEKLLIQSLHHLENDTTIDVETMLKALKAPAVIYFIACRYIDGHNSYVPEKVRLGTNNVGSIISANGDSVKSRPSGETSNNSHLKQYLRAIGKTAKLKNIAKTSNGKNTGRTVNVGINRHSVTNAAIARAALGFRNKNRNIATRRARVSKIAPEIQQQISESVLQRRLGAKAFAENSKYRTGSLIEEYNGVLTYKDQYKDKINRLKKLFPNIEKDFIDRLVNGDTEYLSPYDLSELVYKLNKVKNSYPDRKDDIEAAIVKYSAALAKKQAAALTNFV